MQAAKHLLHTLILGAAFLTLPAFSASNHIDGNLVLLPTDKLPPQARTQSEAMTLHSVDPDTLYLYIEQDHGHALAVFDVTDPGKVKFKKLATLDATTPFDFVESVTPNAILIRYRDGSGEAILDLQKPKAPHLRALTGTPNESYILPVESSASTNKPETETPRDYQIVTANDAHPVLTIKSVIQKQTNIDNNATYLLTPDGLTVVRNIRSERKLAASFAPWTNTIDDN